MFEEFSGQLPHTEEDTIDEELRGYEDPGYMDYFDFDDVTDIEAPYFENSFFSLRFSPFIDLDML